MENCNIAVTNFSKEERESFDAARIGTYFIIPLHTTAEPISSFRLKDMEKKLDSAKWVPYDWAYDDLYNRINKIFCHTDNQTLKGKGKSCAEGCIGLSYQMPVNEAMTHFHSSHASLNEKTQFFVYSQSNSGDTDSADITINEKKAMSFRFRCVQIMVMHSGIGFLIIGIEANNPKVYDMLLCSGYNQNHCMLEIIGNSDNERNKLNFGEFISSLLSNIELTDYSDCIRNKHMDLLLRDTTVYSVLVLEKRIDGTTQKEWKEKIIALCLNIREVQTLGMPSFSEPDLRAHTMFAAPINDNKGQWLRWGVYTTFQHTVQVILDDNQRKTDPINVNADNREDNYLPFLLLTLYARYSYLFFSELLGKIDEGDKASIDWLEMQMLRLKASGTFIASDMTPYDNINDFLRYQHLIYNIADSQKLIDSKISIISHQKAERIEKRNQYFEKFLTVFGIVSILCDSIGLIDSLVTTSGNQLLHLILCLGEVIVFFVFIVLINFMERRK